MIILSQYNNQLKFEVSLSPLWPMQPSACLEFSNDSEKWNFKLEDLCLRCDGNIHSSQQKKPSRPLNAAKDEWNCDENLTKRKATAHAFFWVFLSNKINMEKYSFRYRWKKINYSSGNITRENVLTSAPGLPVAPTGPASPSGPWKQKIRKWWGLKLDMIRGCSSLHSWTGINDSKKDIAIRVNFTT